MILEIIIFSLLWNAFVMSTYVKGTAVRMKRKVTLLNSQLIKDVIAKIEHLRNFREMNYRATAYQVGEILCTVRNLLGNIVKLYTQVELNEMSDEELLTRFEEVHNSWYTIENLIRMVEQWEERNSGRRSGPLLDIGGVEESKRWTLLEEGERLDDLRLKERTLEERTLDQGQRNGKRKLWQAGKRDQIKSGF